MKLKFTLLLAFLFSTFIVGLIFAHSVSALSGKDFQAGRIIDDAVFYNRSAMSVTEIQNFLNAKVPTCDTNGAKMYNSTQTRKQYAASKGVSTPFICLKSYKQNTPYKAGESGLCSAINAQSNRSSANIINDVAQACGISAKVLLVLLNKEQSLVVDDWPWPIQYRSATGYGCPDTADCDSDYYGFFNQVYHAALQYKRYQADPDNWNHIPRMTNQIWYQANAPSCGKKSVYIENQATAGLYNYTPYTPNKAALDNLYGTGDSCSAYGNRNFWRMFSDWFGTTFAAKVSITDIKFENQPFTDNTTTASFTVKNISKSTLSLGRIAIAARDPEGNNMDFEPIDNISLAPGATYTYKKSRVLNGAEGNYRFYIARYAGGIWHFPPFDDLNLPNLNGEATAVVTKQPTLTSSLALSTNNIHADENVTATFKIKNNSTKRLNIGQFAAVARGADGGHYDFPNSGDITLDPGMTYTYQQTRSFPKNGNYNIRISSNRPNTWGWDASYPTNASGQTYVRDLSINVKESVTLTEPLTVNLTNPHATNNATAQFKIKNFSSKSVNVGIVALAMRDDNGHHHDFPASPYLTLAPGQEYSYNSTVKMSHAGEYRTWITNKRDGFGWSSTYPANETFGLVRELRNIVVKDAVTLIDPLRLSMTDPVAGGTATATFKIKNFGTESVTIGTMAAIARDSRGNNMDFEPSPYLTLAPGQEYSYSQSRTLPLADNYSIRVANKRNGIGWSSNYPASENTSLSRNLIYNIKDPVRLTSGISIVNSGNNITATFKIKNFGTKNADVGVVAIAGRNEEGNNTDFAPSPYLILTPGQEYTYTSSRIHNPGAYNIWITNKRNNYSWSKVFPTSQDSSFTRSTVLRIE